MDHPNIFWFERQVERYRAAQRRHVRFKELLDTILRQAVRPLCESAVVQVRAKSIGSFADKLMRKFPDGVGDPLQALTDLCAARVIVHLKSEVESLVPRLRACFVIDEANSMDTLARLQDNEFGYRSVHLIVQCRPDRSLPDWTGATVPRDLLGLKAEIQVRTFAQHIWAEVAHDRLYKSAFTVPASIRREMARVAALLEDVDDTLVRIARGVDSLRTNVTGPLSPEAARQEILRLDMVRRFDPANRLAIARIAELLVSLGDWKAVARLFRSQRGKVDPALLASMGLAMCRMHADQPRGPAFEQGRKYLRLAAEKNPANIETWTNLADTWNGVDPREMLAGYHRAFQENPSEPRALAGYLRHYVAHTGDADIVSLVRPEIEIAIRKCDEQAEVGVNIPGAYFLKAQFEILISRPYEGLAACARGAAKCPAAYTLDDLIDHFGQLSAALKTIPELEWGRHMAALIRAARFDNGRWARAPAESVGGRINRGPVLIIAGACSVLGRARRQYQELLGAALADFRGTLISGGTREGVSGIAAGISRASRGRIRSIGYLPGSLPTDGSACRDNRFTELCRTQGHNGFSAIEPLQYWTDLLASGIAPGDVSLLGLGGGVISELEYRLAAVMGARVGVIRGSGEAADRLSVENDWDRVPGILFLPPDNMTVAAFTTRGSANRLSLRQRVMIGRASHERYRQIGRTSTQPTDPAMADWPDLRTDLRESNLLQAEDIARKLQSIGLAVATPTDKGPLRRIKALQAAQIERLAAMEHGRWVLERLQAGWKSAPRRDPVAKLSPHLIGWDELPEPVKQIDREAVKAIPALLHEAGLQIVKAGGVAKTRRLRQ